jgi:UDP-N-acetylmuramate dehydrogenase
MTALPFPFAVENYPLAPHTLYNVGGAARLALLPRDEPEMRAAYAWMLDQPGPRLILGAGSNVLIADQGYPGVVLFTIHLKRFDSLGGDRYYVGGGGELTWLVREVMMPHNYAGVGALTGIPGSVGGALYMNAGTVNGSTCEYVETVDLLTPEGEKQIRMEPGLYAYRNQRFCAPGDVILGAVFRFQPSDRDERTIYEHYIQRRLEKQPQGYCCGSVFKNPPGDHAGRLIEACGLKGTRQGGAIISPQHANFIMNENHATFEDIMALIELVKNTVHERHGVQLEEEVRIIR